MSLHSVYLIALVFLNQLRVTLLRFAYNDLESVKVCGEEYGDDLAAIIVEPVAGNMGVVPPEPGFLRRLRELTKENGSLLIFDEVMTGFRVGYNCAQGHYRCETGYYMSW